MKLETHKQLLKELYRDIKDSFSIYLKSEIIDLNDLWYKLNHSFIVYFHKLKTERLLYKQRKNR